MAKSTTAKDISDFGKFKPRKLAEFIDERVIITDFVRLTFDNKPYYQIGLIVDSTGETIRVNSANKYVMEAFEKIGDATQCPINAIFYHPGANSRTIAVKGWNEPEVDFAE